MNELAMLTVNEDGDIVPHDERFWHLTDDHAGVVELFCTGEVFGEGEGDARAEVKQVQKGGITCPSCLQRIRYVKSVKL